MIYIFCAGRQGRIVYSILKKFENKPDCVFVDDSNKGKISGVDVLSGGALKLCEKDCKILALGNDLFTKYSEKRDFADRISALPGKFKPVLGGWTAPELNIPDTLIMHPGSIVMTGTNLGRFVIISTNSSVDHDNIIEDFVNIAPGVTTGGGVTIGEGTFVGLGAVIFPEVNIGKRCIVGAGSLVRKDVPDGMVVYGNPAKEIKQADK